MLGTRVTDLVGCSVPIQLAGMGAAATPELAAAVSNAGALGMVGMGRPGLNPATITTSLDRTSALTSRPFGVNFIVNPDHGIERRCFEIAAEKARVVEFFYGWPDPDLVGIVHDRGALALWQVGSAEEALAAERAGCDAIVAQGIEAGGHIRGRIGLHALLDEVRTAVQVPVIASGGIGTGRAMAAALVAGADGVRIGTRFLAAVESGAHPGYVAALIDARGEDTAVTDAFSRGWPGAPHRTLASCVSAAQAFAEDVVGERDSLDGSRTPAYRCAPLVVDRTTEGEIGAMPLWAGMSVGAVKRVETASQIVEELALDAAKCLRGAASRLAPKFAAT